MHYYQKKEERKAELQGFDTSWENLKVLVALLQVAYVSVKDSI